MDRTEFNTVRHYEVETLSPLHIGSGNALFRDLDYLEFPGPQEGSKTIALIDHEKVLDIVGTDRIQEWVHQIQSNASTTGWLKRYEKNLEARHISSREIEYREPERMPGFKSMITEAHGIPYLPGSSLKGAIRTALLAEGLRKVGKVADEIGLQTWKKEHVGQFFGTDMNLDLLRFVSPSDALFPKTRCLPVEILNKYHHGWGIKQQRDPLFLEVVPKGQVSHTRILFPKRLWQVLEMPLDTPHHIQSRSAYGPSHILRILHDHHMRLLQREIDFWKKKEHDPTIAADYVKYLEGIMARASQFNPEKETLVRVGFATGWTSITGGWQEACMGYEDFYSLMEGRKVGDLPYPKTRKLAKGYIPFGYLRLREVEADKRIFPAPASVERTPKAISKPPDITGNENLGSDSAAEVAGYTQERLRKGSMLIAEYSPQPKDHGSLKTFKLLIAAPGQEQFVQLSYRSDLQPGQRYRVSITDLDSRTGQVRTISFQGKV